MTPMDEVKAEQPPQTLAARLAKTLAVAAHALPNVFDESTDYFRAFSVELEPSKALTPESFASAASVSAKFHVDFRPADDFFATAKEWGEPYASAFALLETLMRATLSELTVAFARKEGVVRVRMWLFGRLPTGALVGLKTEATET